jgi:hypothetical protein
MEKPKSSVWSSEDDEKLPRSFSFEAFFYENYYENFSSSWWQSKLKTNVDKANLKQNKKTQDKSTRGTF